MAQYESSWYKFRSTKLKELIPVEPPAINPSTVIHEEESEQTQTLLTGGTYNPISAHEIEYVPILPEYPQTYP
ncbi:hypothetical protein PENVUL_c028G00543 [Penicillium vulpinum]|uniref:Uncharacterized protein n=1 Tax=Penicillium vulpinum TaxID=29845 RepID=A0A1V6RT30_9EURO|nr:hypothetical protein PENVUL_c028G00543 [Penicillium vulpinum]